MIHYHGLPISPDAAAPAVINGGHVFISFRWPEQLALSLEFCASFALDNGAFSSWKSGHPVTDWGAYYRWVGDLSRYPTFDFAVIPDSIEGDESENDALIAEWPFGHKGAPVWHLHESLWRLQTLSRLWPRICLGSSGAFSRVDAMPWRKRMLDVMDVVCDADGFPRCKLHGLRMLNPRVIQRYPFASADSTNIAQTITYDEYWKGAYSAPHKGSRAALLRARLESFQSPMRWQRPTNSQLEAL